MGSAPNTAALLERAAQICEEQARLFLAPGYATNQPHSSFSERFACDECARAIRAEAKAAKPTSSPDYSAPVEPRTRDGRSIYSLLASVWFYGKWKAETHAEEEIQALMEARGFWPILGEGALMTMIGADLFQGEAAAKAVKP